MISSVLSEEGQPLELAPGRGDLRRSSVPLGAGPGFTHEVALADRIVSFARLFASQPMVAAMVGWYLRQALRVPLKCYEREGEDGRKRLRPEDHPLARGIEEPWEGAGQTKLTWALLGPKLIHGNALAEVTIGRTGAIQFLPADWRFVTPVMPWPREIAAWWLDNDAPAVRRFRSADQVLHVASFSPYGPIGTSPLEQLGVTLAIEDAAHRHQRSMLVNGVRTAHVVQSKDDRFFGLDPEERSRLLDNVRADIRDVQGGPHNSGRPWLLPPGLEAKEIGQTAVEAALIEQRQIDHQEARGVYGLLPGALGIIERGGELEVQRQMSYTDGLAPELLLLEAAINAQVARGLLKEPDVFVEYDFAGILRGDKLKEIEALRQAISTALMSPEEGRQVLNLPTEKLPPEMGKFYLPRNNVIPVDVPYMPNANGPAVGGEPGQQQQDGSAQPADQPAGDKPAVPA